MANVRRHRIAEAMDAMARQDKNGVQFQRIARKLLRRRYPNLIPLPDNNDQGQDAIVCPLVGNGGDGKWHTIMCSITVSLSKLKGDCEKCIGHGHKVDIVDFAVWGEVTNTKRKSWESDIRNAYGWDLIVHDSVSLLDELERNENIGLVADELHIEPPPWSASVKLTPGSATIGMADGDSIDIALREIRRFSESLLRPSRFTIPVIGTVGEPRVSAMLDSTRNGKLMLISGDGGCGKSGLVHLLLRDLLQTDTPAVLVNADDVASAAVDPQDVTRSLGIRSELVELCEHVRRAGRRFFLLVDQLDRTRSDDALRSVCQLMEMILRADGVVVAAGRERDIAGIDRLNELADAVTRIDPLSESRATECLRLVGIAEPDSTLVHLARNLLCLSLIAEVVDSGDSAHGLTSDLDLWRRYVSSIESREGEAALCEAARLAGHVITSGRQTIPRALPETEGFARLASRGVIVETPGERFRFRHSEICNYLFAWGVVTLGSEDITVQLQSVHPLMLPEIAKWVYRLQRFTDPEHERRYLREVLGV